MIIARRQYLEEVLREARGKPEVAAILAGVNRTHFYRIMDSAGIERRHWKRRRK